MVPLLCIYTNPLDLGGAFAVQVSQAGDSDMDPSGAPGRRVSPTMTKIRSLRPAMSNVCCVFIVLEKGTRYR